MPIVIGAVVIIAYFAYSIRRTLTSAPTARAIIDGIPFYGDGGNGRFYVYNNIASLPSAAVEGDRAYTRTEDHYWIWVGRHWADDIIGANLAERARRYG